MSIIDGFLFGFEELHDRLGGGSWSLRWLFAGYQGLVVDAL